MKKISQSLLSFLQSTDDYNKADLFLIQLPNGQVITATTAQEDINFATPISSPAVSYTYRASAFGAWERGPVTSEASYAPKANKMKLTVAAALQVNYPGTNLPLSAGASVGMFDRAQVNVYTIYWPIGGTIAQGLAMGALTTFVGQITKITDSTRSKISFEVADLLYLLNTEVPLNIIQSSCRHTLFDSNCTLNQNAFAFANSVAAGSTQQQLNLSANVTTASFWNGVITFTQGFIVFTSGQNKGLSAYIKNLNTDTQILLDAPLPFPVAVGDTFNMFPGCDKSLHMCQFGFDNLINNGSEPFVPNPELAL